VLNGSRLLVDFGREGKYWVATTPRRAGAKHGECEKWAPACDLPDALFIDSKPLSQVLSKQEVGPGRFYFDRANGRIYFSDDPRGRTVEATATAFAFESAASNVSFRNITIEKYASVAQKGAIQGQGASGWSVENCEVRLNSGAGVTVGNSGRVRGSDLHHNGQIGVSGLGQNVLIENNRIWKNNVYGFSSKWEAGGVKLVLSNAVALRGNHVHDNMGPGLWCDIDCRNVIYEDNLVERNAGPGIFHEISFAAVIRNNILRHNSLAEKPWFWENEILVAASEDVGVYDNKLTVSPGKCGIILIDQNRSMENGGKYKTRNNRVHENETTFEGAPCAGGASDADPGDENYSIITHGANIFDHNVYRVPRESGPQRFVWGHADFDWSGLREQGVELNGRLEAY
jgi:hypothetical protein